MTASFQTDKVKGVSLLNAELQCNIVAVCDVLTTSLSLDRKNLQTKVAHGHELPDFLFSP